MMRSFLFNSELDEPFCEIVETLEPEGRQCLFSCQASGFEKFVHLSEKYKCDSISIKNLIEFEDNMVPNLRLIGNKSDIDHIEFSGNFPKSKSKGENLADVLKGFVQVKTLTLFGYNFELHIADVCKNLLQLSFDTRAIKITDIKNNWPRLKDLRVDFARGDLEDLGKHENVTSLRFYDCNFDSLEFLGLFPNLETLVLDGQKKEIELSPLSNLSHLKNLRIISNKRFSNISEVSIPNIKNAYISKIDDTGFIDTNPSLAFFGTMNEPSKVSAEALARGWKKYETKRFGFGGAAIPEVIRK